jgi:acyl-CoA thioesterase
MAFEEHEDHTAALAAFMQRDQYAKLLGIRFVDIGAGRASATMIVRPDMVNGHGLCHGGAIFSFADAVFGAASNSRGRMALAQFCTIAFLRPAKEGDALTAVGQETAASSQRGVFDINVSCGDELIAAFRGHVRVVEHHRG